MDKISVIVPVYNVEPYIRQCVDSIINQTYKHLEIILIDDGSPDNCGMICDEYAAKDNRLHVIHKQNAGVSASRNEGIEMATGEWILFVDADDWLDYEYIEGLFESQPHANTDVLIAGGYVEEYPTRSVSASSFQGMTEKDKGALSNILIQKVLTPNLNEKDGRRFATIATAWNKLYRAAFLKKSNLRFNVQLHPQEDVLFCLDLFEKTREVLLSDYIGYHYRQAVGSSALNRFNKKWPYMGQVFLNRLWELYSVNESLHDAILGRTVIFTNQILKCYFFHRDNPDPYKTKQREFQEYKSHPLVKEFINDNGKSYLSSKQIIQRWVFRLPWMWPVKLLWESNQIIKRK